MTMNKSLWDVSWVDAQTQARHEVVLMTEDEATFISDTFELDDENYRDWNVVPHDPSILEFEAFKEFYGLNEEDPE